jgi:hypothetical protein
MGVNFRECGCSSIQEFINKMYAGESDQLECFVNFLLTKRLGPALKTRNWAEIARVYNGPSYRENAYDKKMEHAYREITT